MRSRTRPLAWLVPLLAACGSLDLPSGQIECGEGERCPRDMHCGEDGLCYSGAGGGAGDRDAGTGDAAGGDGGVVCGGGRLEDFADGFDDLDAWTVVGGEIDTCIVEADGDGVLTVHTSEPGTCGIESVALFEFIDQSAVIAMAGDNFNVGNPDLVFRAELAGRSVQLVLFDGAYTALNCPDGGGCGESGITGDIRDWWRLRHDPIRSAVFAELSNNDVVFPDGVELPVDPEEAACVRLFIGTSGQITGDVMYPIHIDQLNFP